MTVNVKPTKYLSPILKMINGKLPQNKHKLLLNVIRLMNTTLCSRKFSKSRLSCSTRIGFRRTPIVTFGECIGSMVAGLSVLGIQAMGLYEL